MELNSETSIGEIVRANYKTARVFDQHKIDYCCKGDRTLKDACAGAMVDEAFLVTKLKKVLETFDSDSGYFEQMAPDDLCNYIVEHHHKYINDNIPFIQQKLQKLCDVHGDNHKELFEIKKLFDQSAGNLSMHMKKEELMLFPYIKRLVRSRSEGKKIETPNFGSIRNPVSVMMAEHQEEGERFEHIAELTGDFTVPPDGCNTYRVGYQSLRDFKNDLHRHIHLENNILFQRAAELEVAVLE